MRSRSMRLVFLALLTALTAAAEFLRIEVTFEDIGCASCVESLQGRLARVRGVQKVEVDAEKRAAALHLEPGNQVRLAPLLSRIRQDGTKITRVAVSANGTIESRGNDFVFHPSGLTEIYRLQLEDGVAKVDPQPGVGFAIRGTVTGTEAGAEPAVTVSSIEAAGRNLPE